MTGARINDGDLVLLPEQVVQGITRRGFNLSPSRLSAKIAGLSSCFDG
jgi:hypothetical protein